MVIIIIDLILTPQNPSLYTSYVYVYTAYGYIIMHMYYRGVNIFLLKGAE